jgi:hypothetical protein
VKGEEIAFFALLRKCLDPWILPDIRPIATELAELNVVPMRAFAFAKDKHEFVLRTVEASHAARILDPHAQVQELVIVLPASREKFSEMPPIDTDIVHGVVGAVVA